MKKLIISLITCISLCMASSTTASAYTLSDMTDDVLEHAQAWQQVADSINNSTEALNNKNQEDTSSNTSSSSESASSSNTSSSTKSSYSSKKIKKKIGNIRIIGAKKTRKSNSINDGTFSMKCKVTDVSSRARKYLFLGISFQDGDGYEIRGTVKAVAAKSKAVQTYSWLIPKGTRKICVTPR